MTTEIAHEFAGAVIEDHAETPGAPTTSRAPRDNAENQRDNLTGSTSRPRLKGDSGRFSLVLETERIHLGLK